MEEKNGRGKLKKKGGTGSELGKKQVNERYEKQRL